MKNKKFTQAILLTFVLGVWGTIFYKIYDKLHDDEELPPPYEVLNAGKLSAGQMDTFQLLENYNDPFLNKPASSTSSGNSHTATSSNAVAVSRPVVKVPATTQPLQIKYLGLIKNKAGKKSVAIVSVNGASSLLQEGESAGNAKLLKLTNDSILVQVDKQKLYIRRN